jgi:hypothetical protein
MNCKICCNPIEQERLVILPHTVACAACAQKHNLVKPRKGIMCYDHKTGAEIQIVSAEYYNANKNYFIPIGARSAVKNFSKNVCA